jgi:hypothetical protein
VINIVSDLRQVGGVDDILERKKYENGKCINKISKLKIVELDM